MVDEGKQAFIDLFRAHGAGISRKGIEVKDRRAQSCGHALLSQRPGDAGWAGIGIFRHSAQV